MNHFSKFARLPIEVLMDTSITGDAVRVYGFLSTQVWEGAVSRISQREIAQAMQVSQSKISRILSDLIRAGHVTNRSEGRGRRAWYVLTSSIFSQRQGKETILRSRPRSVQVVSVERAESHHT